MVVARLTNRSRREIYQQALRAGLVGKNPRPTDAAEKKLIDKGEARQYVADLLNVGRSTLYRALAP